MKVEPNQQSVLNSLVQASRYVFGAMMLLQIILLWGGIQRSSSSIETDSTLSLFIKWLGTIVLIMCACQFLWKPLKNLLDAKKWKTFDNMKQRQVPTYLKSANAFKTLINIYFVLSVFGYVGFAIMFFTKQVFWLYCGVGISVLLLSFFWPTESLIKKWE